MMRYRVLAPAQPSTADQYGKVCAPSAPEERVALPGGAEHRSALAARERFVVEGA